MTKITDLFTENELNRNIDNGMVRVQVHPEFPELRILNYTEAAQFSRTWNNVTKACRGLIYNAETGEVLARPFPKIHNWDEAEAPRLTWEAPLYHWGNKEDGSLGIMYRAPDGSTRIATRGSFASEQALHASQLIDNSEAWLYDELMDSGYTPLFEIIYPENRIVLDYGNRDEVIYLGAVHVATGAYIPDTTAQRKRRTFDDIRKDLNRSNAEGWVVWIDEYKAVKVKQADYVELHRIVTGLNQRSIWRAIQEGTFEELVQNVPDELTDWAKDVYSNLWDDFDTAYAQVLAYHQSATQGRDGQSQKQFALNVQQQVPKWAQGYVFSIHSGKDIHDKLWKSLMPKAER